MTSLLTEVKNIYIMSFINFLSKVILSKVFTSIIMVYFSISLVS
jgi:hypothetical protein